MAASAGGPGRPEADEGDAADGLGGTPDEIALFALAHKPRRYVPLTDAETRNLKEAVAGTLPALLSQEVRELLKRNAAAVELVMSEQFLANANRKEAVPAALSNRILSRTRPSARVPASGSRSRPQWRSVWALPAVAALAVAYSFYGMYRPSSPNFEIAALDDEILAEPGDTTRGVASDSAGSAKAPGALDYVETAVPRASLADFFDKDQRDKGASESRTLSLLSAAAHQKGNPEFLFDVSVEKSLNGAKDEMVAIRIYDLADPANRLLLRSLRLLVGGIAAHLRSERADLVAAAPRHK